MTTEPDHPKQLPHGFPIVGVGASSGGLEALGQLLLSMPADSGMALIIVTHQHPGHTSLLPELLGKDTKMPVIPASDGQLVEPDHVYVAPPGCRLAIRSGVLFLMDSGDEIARHLPIDYFFRSLAEDQKANAICVILSGAASDGSHDLQTIKDQSVVIVVQEPKTAKSCGMPRSAIATGLVDFVAAPEEIPDILISCASGVRPVRNTTTLAAGVSGDEPPMKKVLSLLHARSGNDFSGYKTNTVRRRIERRMAAHNVHEIDDYVQLIADHPDELDALLQELLISVTNFFRDPEAFEALESPLRSMLAAHDMDRELRVWVPGCATGEEAYSLAILLSECMDGTEKHPKVMIFGTDLDDAAISIARSGLFAPALVEDISTARLERYFTREEGGYRISKEIRDMIVFAPQNAISEPPFTKLDLLSCRNLLIYMTPVLQRRLLPVFAYALNPGGLLLLGPHESLAGVSDRFDPIDKKWKIFRRKNNGNGNSLLQLSGNPVRVATSSMAKDIPPASKRTDRDPVAAMMGRLLLAKFAPACVVVDRKGEIEFIHGRTGDYLEPAAGRPRLNVFEMAREGLQAALGSAVSAAATGDHDVIRENIRVKSNGGFVDVNFTVSKLRFPEASDGLFMVTFDRVEHIATDDAEANDEHQAGKKPSRAEALEREIQYTRESLQSAVEELETSNEELISTNEELQSTNEELQSANEELETSREEMQSLNEELSTVNSELQAKVEELSDANGEMQDLLDGTEIATVYLNNELAIERFTEQATKLISLIPSDVGRFIGDLTMQFEGESIVSEARSVLDSLVFKEREVQAKSGKWYLMRMMPYRTGDIIRGLVITFVNIDELRSAESLTATARDFYEGVVDAVREPLLVLSPNLVIVSANRSFYEMFKLRKEAVEGGTIFDIGGGEWDIPSLRKLLEEILPENAAFDDYQVEHDFPRLGHRVFKLNARRIQVEAEPGGLILLALEDFTGQK